MSDVSDLLTKNQILCLISDRLSAENTRLRADLAAVTAERDRMREALMPFAVWCEGVEKYSFLYDNAYVCAYDVRFSDLRRASAALEGVTEQERQS